jgi:biopolymer transport protein ExbB/TolQ
LHTRFSYLRALAICTPLLGLFGSLAGAISALMGSDAGTAHFPRAIGEALIPSAAGLFVGIVASAAFYVLRERASAAMLRLQDIVSGMFRKIPYDALARSTLPERP